MELEGEALVDWCVCVQKVSELELRGEVIVRCGVSFNCC